MAWKFKVSKFKNAFPRFPKKEDTILDVHVGMLMQSCGNHISASTSYMAFNTDSGGGGNLGVLPLQTTGRVGQSLPTLNAHGGFVTDISFSPFDDRLLATCSADSTVKVWSLPEEERLSEGLATISPLVTMPGRERRVENVAWSPVADGVLAASVHTALLVFDVSTGEQKYDISCHGDHVQNFSWHGNGTQIATTCKDKKLRIIDPRSSCVAQECVGHEGNRDCRVVWLGDTDYILTTGHGSSRQREVKLWDSRSLQSPLKIDNRDSNTGTLMPLFDEDTKMLLLLGKGDNSWAYLEVSTTSPYLTQNAVERTEQIKGACLIPKRGVNVMEGEVDRLLLLVHNSILPLPYIVPRKQYKDFHADLFPDTKCGEAAVTSNHWFAGENGQVGKMSLDPAQKSSLKPGLETKITEKKEVSASNNHHNTPHVPTPTAMPQRPKSPAAENASASSHTFNVPQLHHVDKVPEPAAENAPASSHAFNVPQLHHVDKVPEPAKEVELPHEPSRAAKAFASLHMSKCKYLKGTTEHPSSHIVNIRRLCRTLPGESNLFYANTKRCAVPLDGSGGLIGILELDKPVRLPDTGIPSVIQNGSKVNDMAWDPFDDRRIVVACENAKVYIWRLPEGGLTETITEPESYLMGHTEKIYFVQFHPLAKDIVMTSAYDLSLKIWDLTDNSEKIDITCHPDQIFCAEWSPDGRQIATVCKDGKVRIFDPRTSLDPIHIGEAPEGSRGARVVWTCNMKYLVVSGFNRSSIRQLLVYDASTLGAPLHTIELDVSPAILVPHYDEGTSTAFVTGRGDSSILAYEVSPDYPHLFELSSVNMESPHQGVGFMPKSACNVRAVEFARAWRLTQTNVEPLSFTVPRVKTEYFQDDLYPDTIVPGVPSMSSHEWLAGDNTPPTLVSLRPADMKPVSEAPVEAPKPKKYDSYNPETYKTDEDKKEELLSAITNKLDLKDEPLPQDVAEGVDSDEWDDD